MDSTLKTEAIASSSGRQKMESPERECYERHVLVSRVSFQSSLMPQLGGGPLRSKGTGEAPSHTLLQAPGLQMPDLPTFKFCFQRTVNS